MYLWRSLRPAAIVTAVNGAAARRRERPEAPRPAGKVPPPTRKPDTTTRPTASR
ncbi:MAG: hypothetical protein QGF53_09660 [Alphaproteobacteria bacterium]|nr:hypothetical protein [Alphaproteobacteria bacterium]